MFGKKFLTFAALAGVYLGAVPAWGALVDDEVVFEKVTRVSKKYNNCTNNGNTYDFEVTGLAAGAEKTILLRHVWPNVRDDDDDGRAEADMADFCEKAALLTKSQPDKYDLYILIKYDTSGSGGPSDVGLCTSTSGAGRIRGTQLVCELR